MKKTLICIITLLLMTLTINVYANDKLILTRKKQRLAPSEMETLKIDGKILEGVSQLRLEMEEL